MEGVEESVGVGVGRYPGGFRSIGYLEVVLVRRVWQRRGFVVGPVGKIPWLLQRTRC